MGNVKKNGVKNTTLSKIVKKEGENRKLWTKNTKTIHKNDTITSKKGTF